MADVEALLDEQTEIPRVRFTQRERRGALLGRSWTQLFLAAAVLIGVLLAVILFGWGQVWWLLLPGVPLLILALWMWHGESLLKLVGQSMRYIVRAMQGRTKFRRKVWARVTTTALPTGKPAERIPVPVVARKLTLPGGLADVQFVDIPTRGGFVYNAKDAVASVTIRVRASAWMLRDDSKKIAVHGGFGSWLSGLEGLPGLTEVDLRVRVDRAPSTELVEYAARRDEERESVVSDAVQKEYDWLVATEQARSMEFTSTITATFNVRQLSMDIRDSGGGLTGLSAILTDRVKAIRDALPELDVEFEEWLTADGLDAAVSNGLDPMASSARRERLGRSEQEADTRSPLMAIDEKRSTVEIDDSVHRTLWIHEWPRTRVRVGFLRPLLYTGTATRCLTIRFRPVPIHEAIREVGQAATDIESAARIRERMGNRVGVLQRREEEDLEEREEDLADGYTDGRFRAFVSISAPNLAEVRRDQTSLEQAGYQAHVRMGVMHDQQWAALATAALPVPTRAKRSKK